MAEREFKEGDRVEVTRGAYKGCRGVVDDHGIGGVPVLIESHGRPLHLVEIPAHSLRLIEPPEK
jgi:transcription antitermination factor NusG